MEDRGAREAAVVTAGIDYNTQKINIVVLDEGDLVGRWLLSVPPGSGEAFDRARKVKLIMPGHGFWQLREVQAVGIEEPRGQGNGSLHRVQGAILACLPHDLLVAPMLPNQWKKHAGIGGGATKEDVRVFTEGHEWRARNWTQDDCDAWCIARAVQEVVVL